MSTSTTDTDDLAARLVEFVGALRTKGIPAGTSETVDAAAVMEVLGLDRRDRRMHRCNLRGGARGRTASGLAAAPHVWPHRHAHPTSAGRLPEISHHMPRLDSYG